MKKIIILGIIFLFVGMSFTSISGNQINNQTIKSSGRGNILYVGGSGEGNYTKIQDAIDNASDGDKVFVYDESSPYYENVIVNKSIDLIGEDRDTTVIDASDMWEKHAIYLTANYSNISGFTLTGGQSGTRYSGIYIISDFNTVQECNLIDSDEGSGVTLHGSNNLINNNLISRNGAYGVWVYRINVTNNVIRFNIISSNGLDGIALFYGWEGAYSNLIYNNNFINNSRFNARDHWINKWDNGYPSGGNYWDDYTGKDNDGDGIGDTPYRIYDWVSEDRYPLMEPYGNHPPNKVIIDGPTHCKVGVEYNYTFNVTDGDGDSFKFYVYWGGGTSEETGLYPNGTIATLNHSWDTKGTYIIRAKAEDEHGAESPTGELTVTIPRNKVVTSNMLLLRILERFPLLQQLLDIWK